MLKLRDYQIDIKNQLCDYIDNTPSPNICVQLETGAGKTVIFSELTSLYSDKLIMIVAHRNILIAQASKKLSEINIKHQVIGVATTIKACKMAYKKHCVVDNSNVKLVSIDTLLSRVTSINYKVDILIIDEGHHVTEKNKWGKLYSIIKPNLLIGFTATPCRNDGVGLGRNKGGLYDNLIQAKDYKKNQVAKLILNGYLSDFEAYGIPSSFDLSTIKTKGNDYDMDDLADQIDKSTLMSDAVIEYKKLAKGRQALVFCARIKNAINQANKFKEAGISCAVIHSKMGVSEIQEIMLDFKYKVINVLCSVDMIGEGYDCPAVECVILQRKTKSLGLHRQQVGRGLRPNSDPNYKTIIIDQCGNLYEHGLPTRHIDWGLNSNYNGFKQNNLINCLNCNYLLDLTEIIICAKCGEKHKQDRFRAGINDEISYKYINKRLIRLQQWEVEKELEIKLNNNCIAKSSSYSFRSDLLSNVINLINTDLDDEKAFEAIKKAKDFWNNTDPKYKLYFFCNVKFNGGFWYINRYRRNDIIIDNYYKDK
jgi:superfamily II DNA or RNA helicase